jgi:hypothetical protein
MHLPIILISMIPFEKKCFLKCFLGCAVTASMAGYSSRSTSIFLPNHTAITLDFILDPLPGAAVEEKNIIPITEASETKPERITPVEEPEKNRTPTTTIPVEMVIQKPAKIPRKGLNSIDEEAGLGSSIPLRLVYVLPLISVAAVLVCLYLASRGSYRYHTARQRLSRV